MANPWHVVGTGDFNGDGKSDILWQNDDGTPDIWLMNGESPLSSSVISGPDPTWHAVGAGDFNGDGKSDILWQNDNGTPAIWLMNGAVPLSSATIGGPDPTWSVSGVGDFNGDGKSDILWRNDNGTLAVWLMNGANVIGTGIASASPLPVAAVPDPDVTVTSYFHSDIGGTPANAVDGESFNVLADDISLTLQGLSNTRTFIYGSNDTVSLTYASLTSPTGPETITDNGHGMKLSVNELSTPSLQRMVTVNNFAADLTATLAVSAPAAWPSSPGPPSVVADGHGGSIVGGFVDLVGDAAPDMSRITSFRAYA